MDLKKLSATCHGQARLRPRAVQVTASYSGGRPGGRNSSNQGFNKGLIIGPNGPIGDSDAPARKLVLPGQQRPNAPGSQRLVIPDKGVEKLLADGAAALGPEVTTATQPNRYRPPAGFMNDDVQEDTKLANMDPNEMLNRLRARAGRWHQLARFIPVLYQNNYDSGIIEEMTGLTPAQQNKWSVAATIYESLVQGGQLEPSVMERFDAHGDDLLHPFRFLNAEMRTAAAQYIIDNNFDEPMCEILARSMKEWERRPTERMGFANTPGDCLAFKYLRDAMECRFKEEQVLKLQQGLKAAETKSAKQRVLDMLEEDLEEDSPNKASLTIIKLDPEDLGTRPLPVLGELGRASSFDMEQAPKTSQEGAFGMFSATGNYKWVALPQWKALAMTRHPVALFIADCLAVPAMLTGTKTKSEEDKRRLQGPGLLVADKGQVEPEDMSDDSFYLAAAQEGQILRVMEGGQLKERGLAALATVIFVARPPTREVAGAMPGDNLLQL